MRLKFLTLIFALTSALFSLSAHAESFTVEDIQIKGLQRVQPGTLFKYLPIEVGDVYEESETSAVIRELFKTGFFHNISVSRENNILVIVVEERPAITAIDFNGLEVITEEAVNAVLDAAGISQGRIYNRSLVERLENELIQQYFARGYYNIQIDVTVVELAQNLVSLNINVLEGETAKIMQVKIVGNESYSDEVLKAEFLTSLPVWFDFWSKKGQYSKPQLNADTESLTSFYLDRGFMDFAIQSTQVSLSPDKEGVYITININEGPRYVVSEVSLVGELVLTEEELTPLIVVKAGQYFSRTKLLQTSEILGQRLGMEGYAFPNINPIPDIDKEKQETKINIFIDPGQRVYVRRINILGNIATQDEVFRREMRQLEGAWYSSQKIALSKKRIGRLRFVETVEIDEVRVPGKPDMVDLDVRLKEKLAGNFSVGAGYGQSSGVLVNAAIEQDNFLGSGNRVSLAFSNTASASNYQVDFYNPYHTLDGVSRGFNFLYTEVDTADKANVSEYESSTTNLGMTYGIPISETDYFHLITRLNSMEIDEGTDTAVKTKKFLEDHGDDYLNFELRTKFTRDTRNRSLFTTAGSRQNVDFRIMLPGSDLEYYTLTYKNNSFFSLSEDYVLNLRSKLGLGGEYAGTTELPFYDKYYAGGPRSVRGFEKNSLSPRDEYDEPYGGDFTISGTAELFFPTPIADRSTLRTGLFVDVGNTYEDANDLNVGDLRASMGLGITWMSPFGMLTASIAAPLKDKTDDDTESFQFRLGGGY